MTNPKISNQAKKWWQRANEESSKVHDNPGNPGWPFVSREERGLLQDQQKKAERELEKQRGFGGEG